MRRFLSFVAVFLVVAQAALADDPRPQATGDQKAKTIEPALNHDELLALVCREFINRCDIRSHQGESKLKADELPEPLRKFFGQIDANHDGSIDADELQRTLSGERDRRRAGGAVLAQYLYTVADDFIIDIYHNGKRVPDEKRELLLERFGATSEKVNIEVKEGDWLVFNVVNNRIRWGGSSYFAVAGLKEGTPRVGFTTELTSGHWSCCDDPSHVPLFIADPDYLAHDAVQAPKVPWSVGDSLMNQYADGWAGKPVWGASRNTWIKFVASTPQHLTTSR